MNASLLLVTIVLAAPRPADARENKPAPRTPPSTGSSSDSRDDASPTAEDILRALQRQRPRNEVVPPGSAVGHVGEWKQPRKPLLWPDSFSLVDRTGALRQDGGHWWFHFDPAADDVPPSMELLPNGNLEAMVRMATGSAAPMRFTVSGEMTVFEGRNFLLVRAASRTSPPATAAEPAARPPDRLRSDASAEDVMSRLRQQAPEAALLAPSAGGSEIQIAPGGRIAARIMPDGASVVQRVGRLVRQDGGWTFVSDSQRADAGEAPLRLLPNQTTENMIAETQKGTAGLVFTVSGETTLYFGRNHLLPRVAIRRIDLGNLRP